jgi:hypothetical protein
MASKLPGYNCHQCGYDTCSELPPEKYDLCVFLKQGSKEVRNIKGVIDNLDADFVLGALKGEPSCREFVLPLSKIKIEKGDIIRYRPLGCPVTHFGQVFQANENDLYIGIHLIGPLFKQNFKDVGICLVLAFEGLVVEGQVPEPCKTVRFIPEFCMMKKVHSSIVTHSEGRFVRLEGIDLKIWGRA